MKLSYSTRGWYSLPASRLLGIAHEMRFSGIELYDLHKHPELFAKGEPFHKYSADATLRALRDQGTELVCLDTSLDLTKEASFEHMLWTIKTAGSMRVPFVSAEVMSENEELAVSLIARLLDAAKENRVTILIKTKGIYADTKRLAAMLDSFADDSLGVLWDMHHSYCDFGESADTTIKNIGGYVKHVHLRDSDEDGRYCIIGEGILPIPEMMRALSSIDYDGFVSLEWKPEWVQDVSDHSFIFPHFISYMSQFENVRSNRRKLYLNHDGTGEYIWKKDELIDLTFPQVLDRVVEEFPNQYAFKYTTLDYTRTYEEFREDVDNFARALVSLGVRAGSKVAIWATNVPAWYITFWAATKIGAILVTVNTAYKIHEIEYLLKQSDTHTLLMIDGWRDSDYLGTMKELCPELDTLKPGEQLHSKRLPFLRNIITIDCRLPGCLTWDEALLRSDGVPDEELSRYASGVDKNDVCNMQYTSGTTGFPKGVMLTHYNVVNNGKYIGDHMDLSTADRMMIQVPMFHCFGMVLSMTAGMTHGATIYPLPYFSPKPALECVHKERITTFNGVPTMFIAMSQHQDFEKTDFSSVRTGIMAGSNCPAELMKQVADIMNMKEIVSVYGQTESSPGDTMSSYYDPLNVRTDTVGSAFANVECKIVDPETGRDCPAGVDGEFVARGYNIMKGYYKMPKATAETIDKDGWLHTGDLARMDENGNYYITGRLKDMIIRGGENIYPKEIEEFIYTHPSVKDVQVIGVPDKKMGEEVMACIILKEGESVSEDEMKDFITASIARHKVPRYIRFMDEFPMNAAGKILKYKMRDDAARELALND